MLLNDRWEESGVVIQVLNFGTFHMGETSDENKTEFDENDKKNQKHFNNKKIIKNKNK